MTEAITASAKAKTTKHAGDWFGLSHYGIPKFEMPSMELPEALREMTDKNVAQTRDNYAKAKAASEEAADLLKNVYATATRSATAYNLKLAEIARANTNAAFDYAHELLGVKSPLEFFALSTAQIRKQFNIASAQNKELFTLVREVAAEAAEPIKKSLSNAANKAI
jgi:phasin